MVYYIADDGDEDEEDEDNDEDDDVALHVGWWVGGWRICESVGEIKRRIWQVRAR